MQPECFLRSQSQDSVDLEIPKVELHICRETASGPPSPPRLFPVIHRVEVAAEHNPQVVLQGSLKTEALLTEQTQEFFPYAHDRVERSSIILLKSLQHGS